MFHSIPLIVRETQIAHSILNRLRGAILGRTMDVKVRVQPSRQAKIRLGQLTVWEPEEPSGKLSDDNVWQAERIKRYGSRFNTLIKHWQNESKSTRQFFLDGTLDIKLPLEIYVFDTSLEETITIRITTKLEWLDHLADFWQVITSNLLPKLPHDTVMFRGVKYDATDQLLGRGYVVENVLTNWSSSQKIAQMFAKKTLFQCKFPRGTRYLFTGHGSQDEFEYIIPGGQFRQVGKPIHKIPAQFTTVTLIPLVYDPENQKFDWPSDSVSPTTRANYQLTLHDALLDFITNAKSTNMPVTLAKQRFEQAKTRFRYQNKPPIDFDLLWGPATTTIATTAATLPLTVTTATSSLLNPFVVSAAPAKYKKGGVKDSGYYLAGNAYAVRLGGAADDLRRYIVSMMRKRRPQKHPTLVIKLGPPASGKTTAAKIVYRQLGLRHASFLPLDIDDLVMRFTDFNKEAKELDAQGASRSKRVTDLYFQHRRTIDDLLEVFLFRATTGRLNVELESTGSDNSTKWILGFLPTLKRIGYRIIVVYPYAPLDELSRRLTLRNNSQLRQVSLEVQEKLKMEAERNLKKFLPFAQHVYVLDNSGPRAHILVDLRRNGPDCKLNPASSGCKMLPSFLRHL